VLGCDVALDETVVIGTGSQRQRGNGQGRKREYFMGPDVVLSAEANQAENS